jgi:ABC-type phosphate transport system substrate-binding protein
MSRARILGITGLCTILTGLGGSAWAQTPDCSTLNTPDKLIYMKGTTAVAPVISLFAAGLKRIGVTLLYNDTGDGCGSTEAFAFPTSVVTGRDVYTQYDETSPGSGKVVQSTCNATLGQMPNLVINDVAWRSCYAVYSGQEPSLPAGMAEFEGPVQGAVPIVASSYTYYDDIMAEELQDLYVCAGNGHILTFVDIYDYGTTSGLRELFARGIGLPNAGIFSTRLSSSVGAQQMPEQVGSSESPSQTIGYTSTEFYDISRNLVNGLKVRGPGQSLAYWPDSSMTSTDKINIREGRYMLQGALEFVAAVDAAGVPTDPLAKEVIDWVQGNPVDPSLVLPFDMNQIYAQSGVVPQCAMKVKKDNDLDLPSFMPYQAAEPCNCSYQVMATGLTCIPGCVPCTDGLTCGPGQICSHGYCEQGIQSADGGVVATGGDAGAPDVAPPDAGDASD